MQSPMKPTPIALPGNPGLFYIPQTYSQPQPFSHLPYVSPPDSERLEALVPQPEGSPAEPEVALIPSIPILEEPFWCFQCQQWHKSKEAQDQAHAVFQSLVSPRPETAQPTTQGTLSTSEGGLAARMSQAIKEAVAAEFAARNMPRAYQDTAAEYRQYNSPKTGSRRQEREWGNDYVERSRGYGERPRDYGEPSRDYEGHYRHGPDYKEADPQQRRYRTPYIELEYSRSSTPADARAWRDANTDLDPDEIRAETDSMVSATFSDMTIQDYKPDRRGNNGNTKYKSYGADESSSEANGSEEDTGLPLKYLPSPYPSMPTPRSSSHAQSNSKKDRRQSERSEPDPQQGQTTLKLEEDQLRQMSLRRHHRESFQDDDEPPKQRPRGEKPPRGIQQEQQNLQKVQKAMEDPRRTPSKVSHASSKTAPPSTVEAEAAVLAYAQWYAQTYGVDSSFVTNLQSSMISTSSAVSVKPYDRHNISSLAKTTPKRVPVPQPSGASTEARSVANTRDPPAPSEDCMSVYGGYSASESSWKSENTVKCEGPKHTSNHESVTSSLRGGRTEYSSPASSEYLEPLMRYLQQARVEASGEPHLGAVPPKAKTIESDTTDVRGDKKARNVLRPVTPPATVLAPVKPEAEPSPLVLERSRRQYSLVLDQNSQALQPVTVVEPDGTPTKKGKGGECCSNRENEGSPTTERRRREYTKSEELSPCAKGIVVKVHSTTERTYPMREPAGLNDLITTAQNVRQENHGQKPAHRSKSSTQTKPYPPLPRPTIETIPDDYDTKCSEGWTWDTKLGGYVNINYNNLDSGAEKFMAGSRELENDNLEHELRRTTRTPCNTERGQDGDAQSSVFDFQLEKFSDDESDPGNKEYNEDDWEDEEPEEEDSEYASDTDSEQSYTDEVLLELLSDGKYSDVVSGMFSDVDTEVTTFPGADGDRVVGPPRDLRTRNSYETGTSAQFRNQRGEIGDEKGRKCRREGGERQAGGGNSYGRVYARRDGGSMKG